MCYNCTFNILSYTFSKQTIHVKIMIPGHILFTSQSLLYLHIDFLQPVNLIQIKHYIH